MELLLWCVLGNRLHPPIARIGIVLGPCGHGHEREGDEYEEAGEGAMHRERTMPGSVGGVHRTLVPTGSDGRDRGDAALQAKPGARGIVEHVRRDLGGEARAEGFHLERSAGRRERRW